MERLVLRSPTDMPKHVATHRLATFIATLAMVAVLAAMVAGIHEIARGAPIFGDDPTTLLFATG